MDVRITALETRVTMVTGLENDIIIKAFDTYGNLQVVSSTGAPTDSQVETAVNDYLDDHNLYSVLIDDNASGSIASFPDGADDFPVKSLVVGVEPKQNLNGYANPWPAGGGKNKLSTPYYSGSPYTSNNVTFTQNSDGSVTVSASSAVTTTVNYQFKNIDASSGLKAGHYIASIKNATGNNGNKVQFIYGGRTSGITYATVTESSPYSFDVASDDATLGYCLLQVISGFTGTVTVYPMIRLGTESDATYAPYSNICPISGSTEANLTRTGKNLCGYDDSELPYSNLGISITRENNVYKVVASNVTGYPFVRIATLHGLKKGTYRVTLDGANGTTVSTNLGVRVINRQVSPAQTINSPNPFTLLNDITDDIYVELTGQSGLANGTYYVTVQLELGSSATPYEPYIGQTTNLPFNRTVYGGTLNVTTGVLTVTMRGVDGGDLTWYKVTGNQYRNFYAGWNISSDLCPKYDAYTPTVLSSDYKSVANSSGASASTDNYVWIRQQSSTENDLCVKDTAKANMTTTEFKTAMTGVTFVYELITPYVYQLTPTQVTTLLGQNNIFADTGDTEVVYFADTKLYIQKLTGSTEDDMVANQNIASGKYFLIGNELFYSTSAIAQGASIIVGTNCTRTNLAEALNALNA